MPDISSHNTPKSIDYFYCLALYQNWSSNRTCNGGKGYSRNSPGFNQGYCAVLKLLSCLW